MSESLDYSPVVVGRRATPRNKRAAHAHLCGFEQVGAVSGLVAGVTDASDDFLGGQHLAVSAGKRASEMTAVGRKHEEAKARRRGRLRAKEKGTCARAVVRLRCGPDSVSRRQPGKLVEPFDPQDSRQRARLLGGKLYSQLCSQKSRQ